LMEAAPSTDQGAASGLLATARVAGQALSVAVAGAVFLGLGGSAGATLIGFTSGGAQPSGPALEALEATFLHGFHAALRVCAGFAALGALTAVVRGKEAQRLHAEMIAAGSSTSGVAADLPRAVVRAP